MKPNICVQVILLACFAGCAAPPGGQHDVTERHRRPANTLRHYHGGATDPDWLARAARFHGHLGPWLVMGAMIGQDAIRRLGTDGYWAIEVMVWLPPERQCQPWSCILDGLQFSTGATLGKQNIRMGWSPGRTLTDRPAVSVIRREAPGQLSSGYIYRLKPETAAELSELDPKRFEELSREIATRPTTTLFDVELLAGADIRPEICNTLSTAIARPADNR